MIITICPNCQHTIVFNPSDRSPQQLFTCSHCGFSDYAYVFMLRHKYAFSRRRINEMSVADVIKIIDQQITEQNINSIDINKFIYDLHNRCKYLSPVILSMLINSVLEFHNKEQMSSANGTLFMKYEYEHISLDKIYEKLKEIESTYLLKKQSKVSDGYEDCSTDIQFLRRELKGKAEEIDSWIKEYEHLMAKYENIKAENETLKKLIRK